MLFQLSNIFVVFMGLIILFPLFHHCYLSIGYFSGDRNTDKSRLFGQQFPFSMRVNNVHVHVHVHVKNVHVLYNANSVKHHW